MEFVVRESLAGLGGDSWNRTSRRLDGVCRSRAREQGGDVRLLDAQTRPQPSRRAGTRGRAPGPAPAAPDLPAEQTGASLRPAIVPDRERLPVREAAPPLVGARLRPALERARRSSPLEDAMARFRGSPVVGLAAPTPEPSTARRSFARLPRKNHRDAWPPCGPLAITDRFREPVSTPI